MPAASGGRSSQGAGKGAASAYSGARAGPGAASAASCGAAHHVGKGGEGRAAILLKGNEPSGEAARESGGSRCAGAGCAAPHCAAAGSAAASLSAGRGAAGNGSAACSCGCSSPGAADLFSAGGASSTHQLPPRATLRGPVWSRSCYPAY